MCSEIRRRPDLVTLYLANIIGTKKYKIGYTNCLKKRKNGLKNRYGPIEIIATAYCNFEYEDVLHKHFKGQRIYDYDREVFYLFTPDIEYIVDLFQKISVPIPVVKKEDIDWSALIQHLKFWLYEQKSHCDHSFFFVKDFIKNKTTLNIKASIEFLKSKKLRCDCDVVKRGHVFMRKIHQIPVIAKG